MRHSHEESAASLSLTEAHVFIGLPRSRPCRADHSSLQVRRRQRVWQPFDEALEHYGSFCSHGQRPGGALGEPGWLRAGTGFSNPHKSAASAEQQYRMVDGYGRHWRCRASRASFLVYLWTGQGKNEPVMHSLRRRRMTIMTASAVMATVIVLMMWILVRA
jgi:hypothetical protein